MTGSQLLLESMQTDLVPSPVEYAVLLPPGYSREGGPIPLVLLLHGGGGDRSFLMDRMRPLFDSRWADDRLPPMVVATPSTDFSFYLDYRDASQKWEQFVLGPSLERLRAQLNVDATRDGTVVGGISMGGIGSLRMAFKYPSTFFAIVAMEPSVHPALVWEEAKLRHHVYLSEEVLNRLFGMPFYSEFWAQNNPATLVRNNADAIRAANMRIYLEVGVEDFFNLDEGAEFLHRVLWDNSISHEYRLVLGADHVGRTLNSRFSDAFAFVERQLRPDAEPDPTLDQLKSRMGQAKAAAEAQSPPWRGEFAP